MAQTQTQTQPKPAQGTQTPASGGRPANPATTAKTPQERARGNLQYALDRSNAFIHDGPTSYARRARFAARNGVPKEIVIKGLDAMQTALNDARKAVDRAYDAPTEKAATKSRIEL